MMPLLRSARIFVHWNTPTERTSIHPAELPTRLLSSTKRFGTNNFPDCSNMCHEATSLGLAESIGIGKGTVLLEDFDTTDPIFVIGQNPGTNSPRMMATLREASRRGFRLWP
jgi:anaerobic selenocysteine-containing dehydrogenase